MNGQRISTLTAAAVAQAHDRERPYEAEHVAGEGVELLAGEGGRKWRGYIYRCSGWVRQRMARPLFSAVGRWPTWCGSRMRKVPREYSEYPMSTAVGPTWCGSPSSRMRWYTDSAAAGFSSCVQHQ